MNFIIFKNIYTKILETGKNINTLDFYPRPRLLPLTLDFEPSTLDPRLLATLMIEWCTDNRRMHHLFSYHEHPKMSQHENPSPPPLPLLSSPRLPVCRVKIQSTSNKHRSVRKYCNVRSCFKIKSVVIPSDLYFLNISSVNFPNFIIALFTF